MRGRLTGGVHPVEAHGSSPLRELDLLMLEWRRLNAQADKSLNFSCASGSLSVVWKFSNFLKKAAKGLKMRRYLF